MTISGYRTLEPRINRRAETHIWPDFSFLRVSLTVQPSQRCRKLYIYHASSFLFCAALVRSFVVQRAVNFVASRLFMHCARSPGWVEKKRPTKSAKKKKSHAKQNKNLRVTGNMSFSSYAVKADRRPVPEAKRARCFISPLGGTYFPGGTRWAQRVFAYVRHWGEVRSLRNARLARTRSR